MSEQVGERSGRGRRPGAVDTKAEILEVARRVFAEKGFDQATMRGIAREAGVDPTLVHHYFASKLAVFVAAMQLEFDADLVLPYVLEGGPPEQTGERLVRVLLEMISAPHRHESVLALMRSGLTDPEAMEVIRGFMKRALLTQVMSRLSVPPLRMEAVYAQIFGLAMARYVFKLEPLASLELEEVVGLAGPVVQGCLIS